MTAKTYLVPDLKVMICLAVLTCTQTSALAAEKYNALLSRATKLMNNNQSQQAVVLLQKAKALKPNNAEAQATLGWAYYQLGNLDQAYKEAKQAVKLDYKNISAHQCLVLLYILKNMPSKAAREMRLMHKLNPKQKCNCPMDSLLKLNRSVLSSRKY